jgi:hypothetical protein
MASWYEWLPPANGGAYRALGLKILQVQGKGGRTYPEVGWAGQLGPAGPGPFRPGSVVRTMCGSRTGGWSLPCVMSD